jgi:hypothetical protein
MSDLQLLGVNFLRAPMAPIGQEAKQSFVYFDGGPVGELADPDREGPTTGYLNQYYVNTFGSVYR